MATRIKEPSTAMAKLEAARRPQRKPHDTPAPLDAGMLKRLYASMLKCRMVDEKARRLFRTCTVAGHYYGAGGREATAVGATIDLLPEDAVAPSRLSFVTHIISGQPLKFLYAQLAALQTVPGQGRLSPAYAAYATLHGITPSLSSAAQLNIATGVALAYQMQKKPNVVVALSGSGSASLGPWHEAIYFAGALSLPIIYLIENTSGGNPGKQNLVERLSGKAQVCGVPGITVDGNDVVAVHRVAQEAIKRARDGHGPTLIECRILRQRRRPEDHLAKRRSPLEIEPWRSRDPIRAMERYLAVKDLWSEEWKQQLTTKFKQEIEEAILFAENSLDPEPQEASRRKPRQLARHR